MNAWSLHYRPRPAVPEPAWGSWAVTHFCIDQAFNGNSQNLKIAQKGLRKISTNFQYTVEPA